MSCDCASGDLTAEVVSLAATEGDSPRLSFTVRRLPVLPATVGTPADLTGATLAFAMAHVTAAVEAPLTVAVDDAPNGEAHVDFPPTLIAGLHNFYATVTDVFGASRTFITGSLRLQRRIRLAPVPTPTPTP